MTAVVYAYTYAACSVGVLAACVDFEESTADA